MKKGVFIVIEGIDGSGKTMQSKLLAEHVFDMAKTNNVFLTREPYSAKYYQQIRDVLKSGKDPKGSAELFTGLFIKDRKLHIKDIKPVLATGAHVICDRYKYSTLAYQHSQGIPMERLLKLHKGMLVPDIVFFIDVSIDTVMKRMKKDSLRTSREVFEKKEFLTKVRQNYLGLQNHLKDENIVIINGDRPIDDVQQSIRKLVDPLLI